MMKSQNQRLQNPGDLYIRTILEERKTAFETFYSVKVQRKRLSYLPLSGHEFERVGYETIIMDLETLQKTPNGNTTLNDWKRQYAIQEKPRIEETMTMEICQAKSWPSREGLAREQQDSEESEDDESRVKTSKDVEHSMSSQSGKMVVDDLSPSKERNCMKVLKGFFCMSLYNTSADIELRRADLFE